MYLRTIVSFLLLLVFFPVHSIHAQESNQLSTDEIEAYAEQSKQLVHFLEGSLNFLGDPNVLASEKDVVINGSFAKYFRDEKVQVEDDLDENRDTPINKDVQAYLKDVDFFFKTVEFNYEVTTVEQLVNDFGQIFYKLTVDRHLSGITVNDDTLDNNQVRYIEINLDPYRKDLKIVSIYTTKPDARASLSYWWMNMPDTWRDFFGAAVLVYDTLPFNTILSFDDSSMVVRKWKPFIQADTFLLQGIDTLLLSSYAELKTDTSLFYIIRDTIYREAPDTLACNTETLYYQLRQFKGMKQIDVSNNMMLGNLNPLSELTELESLNFSNSLIDELTPLRNLNKLESINCSGSPVSSLEALRYMSGLRHLNASKTAISDIDVMSNFKNLESLNLSYTQVNSLTALAELQKLQKLELKGTPIESCRPLQGLQYLTDLNLAHTNLSDLTTLDSLFSLKYLNIDSCNISSLKPLSKLLNLKVLQANSTPIKALSPLTEAANLRFIYCDHSGINQGAAQKFMEIQPDCLVIYNTSDLFSWWEGLGKDWKDALTKHFTLSQTINTETLHQIIMISELDLKYKSSIGDLAPLRMLHRLEILNIEHTNILSLDVLSGLSNIRDLNLNATKVSDLTPLATLPHLKKLRIEKTAIEDLMPLKNNDQLELIYCDKSKIDRKQVHEFQELQPQCLVIYQSDALSLWWEDLDENWQSVFRKQVDLSAAPSREQLQTLVDMPELKIENNLSINNLDAIRPFYWLKSLELNNTGVSDISPSFKHLHLESLVIPNNPIVGLEGIDALSKLKKLNVENTSVSDLEVVGKLSTLKILNLAGTKIKSLKYLSTLEQLESLHISNTRIKNLKPIAAMDQLKELRCHNTSISSSRVENYKTSHPQTEVIFY